MSEVDKTRVLIWGCRGSIAARSHLNEFYTTLKEHKKSDSGFCTRYGINTTCFSVESPFLPPNTVLFIDAGSGFFTASPYYYQKGYKKIYLLQTHYHYDHTIGLTMSLFSHLLR